MNMNKELETMLAKGREKMLAERLLIEAYQENELRHEAAEESKKYDAILSLVPVFLHEYVSISFGDSIIHVHVPGCARVNARFRVSQYWLDGKPFFGNAELAFLNLSDTWNLSRYGAFDGEIDWYETDESFAGLDVALARAAELRDGLEEAEQRAARQRDEYEKWKADNVVKPGPEMLICPLMSHGDEYQRCVGASCAWFVAYRGADQCALKVIAHRAQEELSEE